jgi:putative ABC transport system permease protein
MKALGASNGYVVRDALGQLAILLFVATLIGTIVGYGVGLAVPGAVPFKLEPLAVLAASLALIVTGLAGSLITVKRILSVDPIIALGAGS